MDTMIHPEGVLNVLSLEDSIRDFEIIREQLIDAGYNLKMWRVETEAGFRNALLNNSFDIILADFNLPGYDAFAALRLCKELCPAVPFICVSGSIGEEKAIELIREGAVDYVLKDRPKRLPFAIKRALEEAQERLQVWMAEEKLRDSERNYRVLADSGQALIWTSDANNLCNYFNRVWLNFTGRTFEQEAGNGWTQGVHQDDYAHCLKVYTQAFDKREIFSMEYRLKRYDGEYRWLIDDGCPRYDGKGEFIGYIGHCLDITERKMAQDKILELNETLEQRIEERTSKLLEAISEMEAFSYSVSHDLRAPLRGIHGFTQILLEDYAGKLDHEGQRICSIIRDNSLKMGYLVDDLLAFSRLSRVEMQLSVINMKELVLSIFLEITDIDMRSRINFRVEELNNAPADPVMFRQVWSNLISNAIKYSSKKPSADISVTSRRENGNCVYCIKDNGSGFDMKYAGKLFGVFQRLHSEKEYEGTGVGLAIVQRIVQRHNGKVWGEGKEGEGASFYVSLPLSAKIVNRKP
ncbi:MAG: sensor histidine kinase [Bacteroidales bacterium]